MLYEQIENKLEREVLCSVFLEIEEILATVSQVINNLRNAGDTTLMAESEEELKSLLMKVKVESEKSA